VLLGPPSSTVPGVGSCLSSVVKSLDTVFGDDSSTVRGYEESKLSMLGTAHSVVDVLPLLDLDTRTLLESPDEYILADAESVDEDLISEMRIYTDPAFEDFDVFVGFIRKLAARDVIVFRLTRRSVIGVFFVDKKGTAIRMVLDCRVTNALCRSPPHRYLSTPASLSRIEIMSTVTSRAQSLDDPHDDSPYQGRVVALDLVDSFYQCGYDKFSDMFSFEQAVQARDVGITEALDADGVLQKVNGDQSVLPCFGCLPAGWSWALHACHQLLVRAIVFALAAFDLLGADALDRIVADGRRAPRLRTGAPVFSVRRQCKCRGVGS